MIIKGKPLPIPLFRLLGGVLKFFFKRRFNKIKIHGIEIKTGHSYLLMCNHFSFLDGFLAYYLCHQHFLGSGKMQYMHIMIMKKQLQMNRWLRYFGCFSIERSKRSMTESFAHAVDILSQPGNLLLFYPQGNLESLFVRHIHFEEGIREIIPGVKGPCQLAWSSNLIDYFESTKPSIGFHMLDCGTNDDFDFEKVSAKVNEFHRQAMDGQVRRPVPNSNAQQKVN